MEILVFLQFIYSPSQFFIACLIALCLIYRQSTQKIILFLTHFITTYYGFYQLESEMSKVKMKLHDTCKNYSCLKESY